MFHKPSGKIWSDSVGQLKELEKLYSCQKEHKVDEIGEVNSGGW